MTISTKTDYIWLTHSFSLGPTLRITRNPEDPTSSVRQVSSFKYLGSYTSTNGNLDPDIQYRLGIARVKAFQLNEVLRNTKVTTHIKDNLVKSVLMLSLFYAVQAMPTKKMERQRFRTLINSSLRKN